MITLAQYFHTLSPFAVRFSGDIGIRWYGLSYALGVFVGWLLMVRLAKLRFTTIPSYRITDLIMTLVVGVVLGGRLGYVLFYQPSLLWTFTDSVPFWGVLQVNKGGMASHGGMLGVILGCILFARFMRRTEPGLLPQRPILHILDMAALACPVGLGLGRLANFINGELLGKVVAMPGQPAPGWSVKFPGEIVSEHAVTLTDAQTSALNELVRKVALQNDTFESAYARLLDKVRHGATDLARELEPLISARHPSQLYQAFAEGIVLTLVLWLIARRPHKPGVIGCWFLITYGVLRIITEFWRLPDVGVSTLMGLSRGQQLSAVMVAVGAVSLYIVTRGLVPRVGGWSRASRDELVQPQPTT